MGVHYNVMVNLKRWLFPMKFYCHPPHILRLFFDMYTWCMCMWPYLFKDYQWEADNCYIVLYFITVIYSLFLIGNFIVIFDDILSYVNHGLFDGFYAFVDVLLYHGVWDCD